MLKKLLATAFILSSASALQASNLEAYETLINSSKFQDAVSYCQISSIGLTEKRSVSTTIEYHFWASGHYADTGLNGPQSTPCNVAATVKSIGGVVGNSWSVESVQQIFALSSPRMGGN